MGRKVDIELFVDNVAWYAVEARLRVADLAALVAGRLVGVSRQRLAKRLRVDSPEQLRAEQALVELCSQSFTRRTRTVVWKDQIERNVDWVRTSVAGASATRRAYAHVRHLDVPDASVYSALAGLASTWMALCEVDPPSSRYQALAGARARAERLARGRSTGWTSAAEAQLVKVRPESGRAIGRAIRALECSLGEDPRRVALLFRQA